MHQAELINLLSLDIPTINPTPIGFLEISGMAHYENVNSRIYAYFLNQDNFPELASLFVNSLREIVFEKLAKEIPFDVYNVVTEDLTKMNYRIDITLNDIENKSAVVIENKIYHYLHNDLEDYWNHFDYSDENKLGVLLTLKPHDIPEVVEGKFVNITHSEWLNRIQSNGLPSKLPHPIYLYLNDFFNTIDNLTKSSIMNEQVKFYFDHTKKVQLARETYSEAIRFIETQIETVASTIGWKTHGKKDDWKNIWDQNNDLKTYFTIWYNPLLNGEKKLTIIIELHSVDMDKAQELEQMLAGNEKYKYLNKNTFTDKWFKHFVSMDYSLTNGEIENLSKFILEKMESDFKEIMKIVLEHNYPGKDIAYLKS